MKRIIAVLCALMLVLAGCQPTPEQDAVKQKNTNQLIDKVKTGTETTAEPGAELKPIRERFPDRFEISADTETRHVHVSASVPIEILTENEFPILRVERTFLTDEERLTVYRRLFGKDDLYVYEERTTRAGVMEMIERLMEEPSEEEKAFYMEEEGGTEEGWQEILKKRAESIEEYWELYNSLPEDDTLEPFSRWDGSLPELGEDVYIVGDPNGSGSIYEVAYGYVLNSDRAVSFTLPSAKEAPVGPGWFMPTWKEGTERIDPGEYGIPHQGASVTPESALRLTMSVIEGIAEYTVSDIYWAHNGFIDGDSAGEIGDYAYLVELVPYCGEAEMLFVPACANSFTEGEDVYAGSWEYPRILASVSPEGELWGFEWYSPQKITETVAGSTPLLPIGDIIDIAMRQINRRFPDRMDEKGRLVITRVRLGLFRISETNNFGSGLLVPVWFISCGSFVPAPGAQGVPNGYSSQPQEPLVVINAVDGSIIDPQKGY
ncbi:MAG: DUF6034 family protein [Clostridiales bacterium]|nr:DUF6034 family protein [Clostridiales bacterium]